MPEQILSKMFLHVDPCLMPIFASRVHLSSWGLWDTLKKGGKKEKRQREKQSAFMHGYQVAASPPSPATSRPGPCQLDLKWCRSEATARSCGFPLTLMPWVMPREPGNIICFTCHLIPLTYTNLYKQIPLFMVLISQNFLVCLPPKKFALLQNIRNVQELTFPGENNC